MLFQKTAFVAAVCLNICTKYTRQTRICTEKLISFNVILKCSQSTQKKRHFQFDNCTGVEFYLNTKMLNDNQTKATRHVVNIIQKYNHSTHRLEKEKE